MIEKDLERLGKYAEWICRKYDVSGWMIIKCRDGERYEMGTDLAGPLTGLSGTIPYAGLTDGEKGRWE